MSCPIFSSAASLSVLSAHFFSDSDALATNAVGRDGIVKVGSLKPQLLFVAGAAAAGDSSAAAASAAAAVAAAAPSSLPSLSDSGASAAAAATALPVSSGKLCAKALACGGRTTT